MAKLACYLATAAVGASGLAHSDQGWELRVTNSEGPVSRVCFDTKVEAHGSYFLAGPAQFDGGSEGDWKFQGIFDGFGMVNRFEIRPKDHPTQMCYTSAWMTTGIFAEYQKNPKEPPRGVLFEDTLPSRKPCRLSMCDYQAPNDNNWVNMIPVGDKGVWVSDTPTMVTMDLETLNVTGIKKWADDVSSMGGVKPNWLEGEHLAAGGSAHPLFRPGTQTIVEVLIESPLMMGNHFVDLYTFDATVSGPQNRTKFGRVEVEVAQYFHSFGLTPNYVVLPLDLMNSNVGPGHPPFIIGNFHKAWKGVHVVNFKGEVVQIFDDMEPFTHVHIANTFENASGITMDLVTYKDIPFERMPVMDIAQNLNKTLRDSSYPRGQMRRMHMDLTTQKTTVTKLTDNNKDYDFIKVNPAVNGHAYCIYYAVEWYHDDVSYASMAVMKHDICKGTKLFWSELDIYMNEPFFIANSKDGAEDDGTLIFTANNGQTGKAVFIALDAKTFTEIERIVLPNHIPFTAHGQFIPAASEVVVV